MGLFTDSPDEKRIKELFGTGDLTTIVRQEKIEDLGAGAAPLVDLVVDVSDPISVTDNRLIGVAYWPEGPVIRGVQQVREGQRITFRNVPVKPGGLVAVVMDKQIAVGLQAVIAGGAAPPPTKEQTEPSPPNQFAASLGESLGTVLGVAAVGFILYQIIKSKF